LQLNDSQGRQRNTTGLGKGVNKCFHMIAEYIEIEKEICAGYNTCRIDGPWSNFQNCSDTVQIL